MKAQLRARDLASYLALAHLPREARLGALVLRSFNLEVASVRDAVRDVAHGRMRIQWWRDTLDETFAGRPPPTPLAQTLAKVVRRHALDRALFDRYLGARAMDFAQHPSPLASMVGVEEYTELTQSCILHLVLQCAGSSDAAARTAASHAGKAIGMALLLRSVPFLAAKGAVALPLELIGKHKVSRQALLAGQSTPAACDAVFELACIGKSHMDQARALTATVDAAHRVCLLPLLAADEFYERLESAKFDPFDAALARPQSSTWLQLRMFKHSVMGTY
jgi:NADH dehydrogenase [ubiquinone] 1 alpha subcomplex assembly factor 6